MPEGIILTWLAVTHSVRAGSEEEAPGSTWVVPVSSSSRSHQKEAAERACRDTARLRLLEMYASSQASLRGGARSSTLAQLPPRSRCGLRCRAQLKPWLQASFSTAAGVGLLPLQSFCYRTCWPPCWPPDQSCFLPVAPPKFPGSLWPAHADAPSILTTTRGHGEQAFSTQPAGCPTAGRCPAQASC